MPSGKESQTKNFESEMAGTTAKLKVVDALSLAWGVDFFLSCDVLQSVTMETLD